MFFLKLLGYILIAFSILVAIGCIIERKDFKTSSRSTNIFIILFIITIFFVGRGLTKSGSNSKLKNIASESNQINEDISEDVEEENNITDELNEPSSIESIDEPEDNIVTPTPDPEPIEPQPEQSLVSDLVISVTGKKYHTSDCRTVKQVKQSVTAEQAEAMGYTACKVCNPSYK